MTSTFPPQGYRSAPSALEGIEVYVPAPADEPSKPEVVDFKCPQCGAVTAYSAEAGGLVCEHCGYSEKARAAVVGAAAPTYEFTVETVERAEQGWGIDRKEVECQNCGARMSVPPENLTATCPFCGSNKVIQRAATQDNLRPRFLIPFKLDAEKCRQIARTWLGSSWMTFRGLQELAGEAAFTPIYTPFWTFDSTTRADWEAEVGHTVSEQYYEDGQWKTRTKTEWRWEHGSARENFQNLLVSGTSRLSSRHLEKIKNYDMSALVDYAPQFLAGMHAQAYDTSLDQAWEVGRKEMRERTREACVQQASTSQVRNFSMNLDFSDESWRYILLPVYLSAYPYSGRTYQVMLNGETGTISGQRPVDWNRIWLVAALLIAPGLLLSLIGLLTALLGVGVAIGGCGFMLLMIGIILSVIIVKQAQDMDAI
jgi:Zn finger protein HypA/HybF involved in hydrogenase expression